MSIKNHTALGIVAITVLSLIVLVIIYKTSKPKVIVNCGGDHHVDRNYNCIPAKLPQRDENGELNANDIMLYYNLADNCNFQTLAFDLYRNNIDPFTVIGRFTGEHVADSKYLIKRIETKIYKFKENDETHYKIISLKIKDSSTLKDTYIDIKIRNRTSFDVTNGVDHVYGNSPLEKSILIAKDSNIHFNVDFEISIGGGYECNGKVIF